MKKILPVLILLGMVSCSRVPITNRKQLHLLPENDLVALSLTEYHDFLSQNKVISSGGQATNVKNVANRVIAGVEQVMKEEGYAANLKEFNWEVNLVDNPEANAWCMPGGKIVVYTGILQYTKTNAGLAVVLGHEISHAIARHGNERMSQQLLAVTGFTALDIAMANKPEETRNLFLAAVGLGAEVGVLLPFSRQQESEADHLGLIFMAASGYDPHEAIGFWENMAKSNSTVIPEFLSTHPTDQHRIDDIRDVYMNEAMKYYKP